MFLEISGNVYKLFHNTIVCIIDYSIPSIRKKILPFVDFYRSEVVLLWDISSAKIKWKKYSFLSAKCNKVTFLFMVSPVN